MRACSTASAHLYAVNMGGTAIGTGMNAPRGYAAELRPRARALTGKPIVPAADMIAATWDLQGFVTYSAALREPRGHAHRRSRAT